MGINVGSDRSSNRSGTIKMVIDASNYRRGNKAMASVLLLYYHMIMDGGFGNDQNVYIDPNDFDGFSYLNVQVVEDYRLDIDEQLLREGAIVYLLCDVKDVIAEHEDDYLREDLIKTILALHKDGKFTAIPEATELLRVVDVPPPTLDYAKFNNILNGVYKKYVLGRFLRLIERQQE